MMFTSIWTDIKISSNMNHYSYQNDEVQGYRENVYFTILVLLVLDESSHAFVNILTI